MNLKKLQFQQIRKRKKKKTYLLKLTELFKKEKADFPPRKSLPKSVKKVHEI